MSPSKVEGVARRAGGVCQPATLPPRGVHTLLRPDGHLPLGEELMSPSKVEGVVRRAGGVCRPASLPHARVTHSSALTGTSPTLGDEIFMMLCDDVCWRNAEK